MKLVENLDAKSFEKKMAEDKDAVLLDVRTPMEHQMVRIPNSILIDINNPMFMQGVDKLDKNKSYYVIAAAETEVFTQAIICSKQALKKCITFSLE